MMSKSPLRYPGGKTRACKKLETLLVDEGLINEDVKKIMSPFIGGGSFEFYLQSKYGYSIIANDKFELLTNFWYNVKNNNKELCNGLIQYLGTITKDKFLQYRKDILLLDNSLEKAIIYFIINRCSFSGATFSGGFSKESSKKRFTQSSIDRISKLDLSNFKIYNLDFIEFLDKYYSNNKETLIFLDPPYYLGNKSNLYGDKGSLHKDFNHKELYEYISKKKGWIITYNNCNYIKELYKDFKIVETSWSYSMNKSKKSSEIVIICK